jgi:hypothetical protein
MLWDCKYCQTPKLLGLTHRFCPNCGAPQDASGRYFPSDEEKVAVEDHVFAGADKTCPACREANGARANNCRHCGSPLDGGAAIMARSDVVHEGTFDQGAAAAARAGGPGASGSSAALPLAAPKPKSGRGWGTWAVVAGVGCLGTVVVGFIALIAVFILWKRDATVEVVRHHWERTVEIERFTRVRETAWCDSPPSGGREVSRRREERSTERTQVGEDCRTRKKDQGDGTFTETRECTPRYSEKPVYDDRCTYEVMRWQKSRTAKREGVSLSDSPVWPDVDLSRRGDCDGCEREGARQEKFTVYFREPGSSVELSCGLPEAEWRKFRAGNRMKASVHQLTGTLDCSQLTP